MAIKDDTLLIHSVSKEGAEDLKNGAMVDIIPRIKDKHVKTVSVPATSDYPPKKIKEKDVSL